ncbi:4-coumarate--CoA ligase-like [Actinidia chinensis var. chinensis]|uniref:4-coumarate--CoA ligase-like n=1 Tax=Actinidia chinensis var. chinensis TaxID=1590841 RepID=A0A2R6P5U9_ACTCC|nr:4-coumarate--CoA ligase-like [Actinidia chinensis var. chinensis]
MRHTAIDSRRTIESCTFHLRRWRPFQLPATPKNLDSDTTNPTSKPYYTKRPCLSDRATSFPIDALDMSRLSLFDADDRSMSSHKRGSLRWIARKRRRRGSRSVSGRSSDRSGTRRRCCSVGASAAYATCSDFPVAAGTDSSGELFVNGDSNWASDVSEAARNTRREIDGGSGERESSSVGFGVIGNCDNQGNESGYGSEPGYRGDAEFGYGDEVDEEEDDQRLMFWGEKFGGTDSNVEMVSENTLQKAHHRCRRKKHDVRMVDTLG